MNPHLVRCRSLTEAVAEAFDQELAECRVAGDPGLTLDLSAVEFLSSMALARFVVLDRELKAAGGRLTLVNLRPGIRRMFIITRLDQILDLGARPAEETIRRLAYRKWEEAGRPRGDGANFWYTAERELAPIV